MDNNTDYRIINNISYDGHSFEVLEISSDNPGIDGYLTVSKAPFEFGINGGLFLDKEEILDAIIESTNTTIKEQAI